MFETISRSRNRGALLHLQQRMTSADPPSLLSNFPGLAVAVADGGLSSLQRLLVSGCPGVGDGGLRIVLDGCVALEELSAAGCEKVRRFDHVWGEVSRDNIVRATVATSMNSRRRISVTVANLCALVNPVRSVVRLLQPSPKGYLVFGDVKVRNLHSLVMNNRLLQVISSTLWCGTVAEYLLILCFLT